jgi:hypothetical protein
MKRIFSRGLVIAATLAAPLMVVGLAVPGVALAQGVRPEVGKPLQDASADIKAGRYREALAKVQEAEGVSGKTSNETYLIERVRFSAAQGAGDMAQAAQAVDALSSSGHSSPAERLPMTFAVGTGYYRAGNYAEAQKWLDRYRKEGGTDPQARTLLVQTYYLQKDCAGVSREVSSSSGVSEAELQMLATCYNNSGDKAAYTSTMERLLTAYPKKDYWYEVLARTAARPGFSSRLEVDLYRLRFLTGNLTSGADLEEMGESSLEAGYPGETKQVLAKGFASKAFPAGPAADKAARLNGLADKQLADEKANGAAKDAAAAAAKDGDVMVNLGFDKVLAGNAEAGLAQMEAGLKATLKHPDDAKLHTGEAYIIAGKKQRGREILRTVKGTDGTADIARLWLIYSGGA